MRLLALMLAHVAAASTNWAGYAVSGSTFTEVKGSWVQPALVCPATGSTYAAFWVGIGGMTGGNGGLEQTGTEADCHNGQASYDAWYELLPAGSVPVPLTISAGDAISAEVSIDLSAGTATMTLNNATTRQSFTTTQAPAILDTASAEWIAEAPSQCFGSRCNQLPLANFGTVQFSGSSTTANGHVGTISDASWSATSIALGGGAGSAAPAALSPDGTSFSVAVTQPAQEVTTPRPRPQKRRPHRAIRARS